MIYILHIETSGAVCSVCLSADGKAIAEKENATTNAHARTLTLLIESLLSEQNLLFNQINAVAVSIGPGSYTGLRIGLSAAKGLCYALDIPLIAVSTLQSIAHNAYGQTQDAESNYLATIDARRDEVYMAIFDKFGNVLSPVVPSIVDETLVHSLSHYSSLMICGNGAFKFKDLVSNNLNWHLLETAETHAKHMAQIAYTKFLSNDFADVTYIEPLYLKEFTGAKTKQL